MGQQHATRDQVAVRYADGVDHVWAAWEPSLRRCERIFGANSWRAGIEGEELAVQLRQAQYRAHTASEFAAGLVPPPSALDAHAYLLGSLASCRDALGVLAIRAEMDSLDDDVAEIGLHAVDTTRDAFRGARSTTALVHAWVANDGVDPAWLAPGSVPPASRAWRVLGWCFLLATVALLGVLVVQAALSGAIG